MNRARSARTVWVAVALLALSAAGLPAGEKPAETGTVILKSDGFWRCLTYWKPGITDPPSDKKPGAGIHPLSYPPPSDWAGPDFDATGWQWGPGPFYSGHGIGQSQSLALVCVRGGFQVTDPAAVTSLKVTVQFRGGAVVYVNGKEIGRAHLPEGDLTFETAAETYPMEVYTTPEGKAITKGWGDPRKYHDRWIKRIREITDLAVPAEHLRKGANVLAVEIHRAPTRKEAVGLKGARGWGGGWNHAGLERLELKAEGAGAVPNTSRPSGVQVWNANIVAPVFDKADYADPNDTLRPMKIVGALNGTFSGQVVVSADAALKDLSAKVSPLALKDGEGTIGEDMLRVRYALPGGGEKGVWKRAGVRKPRRFEALSDAPRADATVQPVWVTVKVPPDAAPGEYRGTLTVAAAGLEATEVPVHLEVIGWKLPEPRDYRTHVGLVQSPDTIALKYKAPLWSDEHWKHLEESLKLLGQVGNKTIFIPLMARTNFGNEQSMVRWVKKGEGEYERDYTVMDRYLDLWETHVGKPDVVAFYVWEPFAGGGYFGKKGKKAKGVPVTLLDPETGKTEDLVSPVYGTPESEAFWKPAFDELLERLKKRELAEENFLIGIAGDSRPSGAVTNFFLKIAPYAEWVLHSHGAASRLGKAKVGYMSHVWGVHFAPDPDVPNRFTKKSRYHGWKQKFRKTVFPRAGAGAIRPPLHGDAPLGTYRQISEGMLAADYRGFGRVGADFWGVLPGKKGARYSVSGRYISWSQLNLTTSTGAVLAPGPNGAISTERFEMIREGVQECEAKIYIERALSDQAKRAKLGEELAKKLQVMLDERIRMYRAACHTSWNWFAASGWQARSERLYAAAAEVAAALQE
jgi:hypothetical protein